MDLFEQRKILSEKIQPYIIKDLERRERKERERDFRKKLELR